MKTRPSLRRSFLALVSLALAVFLAVFTMLLYLGQRRHLNDARERDRFSVERFFHNKLTSDADLMSALLRTLARDQQLMAAFRTGDRAALQALAEPIFRDLQRRHYITDMYFISPARVALLRLHGPAQFGDTIARVTLQQAVLTGRPSHGLELGRSSGRFALRVVQPWRDESNRLIGYVELAEDIEHFAQQLKSVLGVEVVVAIRKQLLVREQWEAGLSGLGRTPDWSQHPFEVLIEHTLPVPAPLHEHFRRPLDQRPDYLDVRVPGARYFGAALPLLDAASRTVGEIVFLRDRTALVADTQRMFLFSASLAVVVALICALLLYDRARRYYIAPLLELRAVAERAGQGELSQIAMVHRADELGDLTRSINRMIHDLRAAQAEQTRLVLDAALDAVVTFDPGGRIIDWNRQAEALFGWPRPHAIGRNVLDLVGAGSTRAVLDLALDQYRDAGTSSNFNRLLEGDVLSPEGRHVPVEMAVTPVRGASGLMFSAFFRDVSDRRRLQEELQVAHRLDAIGKLAGGIAHDFNNLITAIVGYLSSVESALEPGTQPYEDALEIRRAADRATALVQQLLAFARKRVVQPRSLNGNELIVNAQRMLRRLVGENIQLDTHLDRALWPMLADPVQLEQVLINLTVNARDALPNGGTIAIQTANVVISGALAVDGALPPGHYATLAVSDNGVGMDADTLAHIFEPFFTTKPAGKGTGLGLPTCYGIIKQAGGFIRVTSEVGRGTTVRIYMPRAAPAAVPDAKPTSAPAEPRVAETILLAEDEYQVRRLLERALQQQGYSIITAINGQEALRLSRVHDGPIHLLLTDVVMPEMSGREAAAAIRRERPDIRVVFMSGYSEELVRLQAELTETAAFIAKPFTPDELRRVVRDVLDAIPTAG
jgi:PAS domain S-box-containing protein